MEAHIRNARGEGHPAKGKEAQGKLVDGGEESEDAGDEAGPPSPDFSQLCLELGAWSPSEPLPGQSRPSPVFVEGFFASLDQSATQSPAQTSPPTAAQTLKELLLHESRAKTKRPWDEEDEDISDDESSPGPSWKVARTRAPAPLAQPGPGLRTPAQASHPVSFQPPISGTVSQPPHTGPAHHLAASTSASSDVATASSAGPVTGPPQPQRLEGGGPPQHPFVRFATLHPGVTTTRPFMPSTMRSGFIAPRRQCNTLVKMREILRKRYLDRRDAHNLVHLAEQLASHAYHFMQDQPGDLSPYFATARLGRKFMVLLYLLRASVALDQDWPSQSWWGELMQRVPHAFHIDVERDRRASPFHCRLANDLSTALAKLKTGVFPSSRTIVDLKRRLFCVPQSRDTFKERVWDPWRQDDEGSHEDQGPSRRL
ncbi:hypothetical protein ACSSS7_002674 [Eimeria intestinalis]